MAEGTVKFYNRINRYGFINGDDGKSYFVHQSGLKKGVDIDEGDRVSFKATEGDKGPKAEEVEQLKKGESKKAVDESEEENEEVEEEEE